MNALIIGYGAMGKNHGKTLTSIGIPWTWHDIESGPLQLEGVSHVLISTPILSHCNVYRNVRSRFNGPIFIEKPITISRKNLDILSDPLIFPGLIERFNPAVKMLQSHFAKDKIDSIYFTRHVATVADNLFLEIGIHDLDLMCLLFDVQNIDQITVENFSMGKKTEYFLNVSIDKKIQCSFCWKVSDQIDRSIKTLGKDNFVADLVNQVVVHNGINLGVEKKSFLTDELTSFLNGGHIDSMISHKLMINILEDC